TFTHAARATRSRRPLPCFPRSLKFSAPCNETCNPQLASDNGTSAAFRGGLATRSQGLNRDFCFLAGLRCRLAVHDSHFDPPQQDHDLFRLVPLHGHDRPPPWWILSFRLVQNRRSTSQQPRNVSREVMNRLQAVRKPMHVTTS